MSKPARLEGKIAVVTGAGRGIGRSICEVFGREGAVVVATARSEGEIGEVAADVEARGARSWSHVVDVTDPASVERMVAAVNDRFGRIDVLVNNAGIYKPSRFLDYRIEDWKRIVDVNLHGTFLCTRAVLPRMLANGYGKIVNVASTAGKWGSIFQSAYNASKHAVMGLTRSLALEVAAQGVTVNAVCPGFVDTRMLEEARAEYGSILGLDDAQTLAAMKARVPQGRFLRPDEVAEAALYLAAPESDGVTGIGMTLAGGMVLI